MNVVIKFGVFMNVVIFHINFISGNGYGQTAGRIHSLFGTVTHV